MLTLLAFFRISWLPAVYCRRAQTRIRCNGWSIIDMTRHFTLTLVIFVIDGTVAYNIHDAIPIMNEDTLSSH